MTGTRVALIGAGRIAHAHFDALQNTSGVSISAVVDPNMKAAERLAVRTGAKAFSDLDEAIASKTFDRAHVLVPPDLHCSVGARILEAGLPCLLEKPIGVSSEEARKLVELARSRNAVLGVNQNYIFHPAFVNFRKELDRGAFGRLRFLSLIAAAPLPQLAAKQFGHWMFERPSNIILEQIVHPLSQVAHLIGRSEVSASVVSPPHEVANGVFFHKTFDVTLKGETCNAQIHMAIGANMPMWQITAHCDDATVIIDALRNSVQTFRRTRFLEAGDNFLTLSAAGASTASQGIKGVATYLGAQLKLVRRSDSFYRSLEGNVRDFHQAIDQGKSPVSDGEFGAHLVDLCADIAKLGGVSDQVAKAPSRLVQAGQPVPEYDVAVFGGTGFIGKFLVSTLLGAGYSVGVIGRSMRGLPEIFNSDKVTLIRGDVTRRADIERGIGNAQYVVNLAHGGGGANRAEIVDSLVGSAQMISDICLEKNVKRLVFISSIAALYLGDGNDRITPATPVDPQRVVRGDYSFAKGEAEIALLKLHKERGLPVTIQRPGVVVGEGTSPFHSGLGMFNNEQHCLGWNSGANPLPFVLAEDVASAILAALKAGDDVLGRTDNIVGKVRLSARDYIAEMKQILGRPLLFHPQSVWVQQGVELGKWMIKKAGGKKTAKPDIRDILSRGMAAQFDTSDTEKILNWQPASDRQYFIERGLRAPAQSLLD